MASPTRSPLIFAGAMAASTTVGAGNVLKNGINSAMGARLGSSVLGTCVGVWCALGVNLLMLAADISHDASTPPWREVLPQLRPWMALGGVIGGISVALQTFLIAPIGAVLLHVLQLSTEMVIALIADSSGCLGLEQHKFTALRLAGVLASVLGAVATVIDFSSSDSDGKPMTDGDDGPTATGLALVLYCGLAVFVGCLRDVQTAINIQLSQAVRSKIRAATCSIAMSSLGLTLLSAVQLATIPSVCAATTGVVTGTGPGLEWWMLTSGPFSSYAVAAPVFFVPIVSLSGFSSASMSGQLAASIAIDAAGLFGFTARAPTTLKVGGVLVVLLGAMLVRLSDARASQEQKMATAAGVARAVESDSAATPADEERVQLMRSEDE
jgi:transporter family-2 protein